VDNTSQITSLVFRAVSLLVMEHSVLFRVDRDEFGALQVRRVGPSEVVGVRGLRIF
jgi:hypothetical protein